jgi:hypothetical protein
VATDDFNRADSGTLGSNWTEQAGTIGVVSNRAKRASATDDSWVSWNADVFANDQYAQGKCYDSSAVEATCVSVRASGSGGAINAYYTQAFNGGHNLTKVVSGSFTDLGTYAITPVNGDVLRVEAEGTNIRAYRNGAQLGSTVVDASLASGRGGLRIYSTTTTATIDDWEGGDIAVIRRWILGTH